MAGQTDLTPEQQEWYREHFGVRYLSVQEQPYQQSRRVRRAKGRAKRTITEADAAAANAQHELRVRLARHPLQSRPT